MAGVASARVANRHALHFVYYSATKKTVSGLTKCVRRTLVTHCSAVGKYIRASTRREFAIRGAICSANMRRDKNTYKISIFLNHHTADNSTLRCVIRAPMHKNFRATASMSRSSARQKIFHRIPRERGAAGLNRSKNGESALGDSRIRAGIGPRSVTANAVATRLRAGNFMSGASAMWIRRRVSFSAVR